jgi:protein-S-isoprenylcysteine O-methyltransferase Ste14
MTLADWVAGCVLWANLPVPVYWLVLHSGVSFWRRHVRAGYMVAIVSGWGSASVLLWLFGSRLLNATAVPSPVKWLGAALIAFDVLVILHVERHLGGHRMVGQAELTGTGEMKTDGIYARIRHPRYAAMLVSTLGACLIAARPVMWLIAAIWAFVVAGMIRVEERELAARFGSAYENYRRQVPAVIPIRTKAGRP